MPVSNTRGMVPSPAHLEWFLGPYKRDAPWSLIEDTPDIHVFTYGNTPVARLP